LVGTDERRQAGPSIRLDPHLEQDRCRSDKQSSPAQHIDRHKFSLRNPFFSGFDRPVMDRLVSHAVTRRVKKGNILFRKGDPGTSLYAVCVGSVRISVPSEQGQDAIFNLIPPESFSVRLPCWMAEPGPRTRW